jgi:ADP-heptose:LPS heptosyltransferase
LTGSLAMAASRLLTARGNEKLNIKLMKSVDKVLGGMAARLLPAPRQREVGEPRRVLVIRPGGIGDAVMLVPALLALEEKFPQAEITVLAEQRNAAAFSLCCAVDHLLRYDDKGELLKAVRGNFDVVIDSEQWHRLSAVVARLTGAPVSIGFATNDRKRLFTEKVPYSHDEYEADSFMKLLAPLGITPPASAAPFLSIPEQAAQRAEALLPMFPRKGYLALFPGASIPERRWGAERFRQVADHLALRGIPVVVIGGKEDAEDGDWIVRGSGGVNLAGKSSLLESAAVVERSALLVSGDSGILHIGVGLGIPTVSLFGPGIEAKWGPRGEGHIVLNRELPCSPCTRFGTTPPCPDKARCLSEIPPAEVVKAVMALLEKAGLI